MMDPAFLYDTLAEPLPGVPLTLKLAASSVAAGAVLALAPRPMRLSRIAAPRWLARAYVFVFRGTPLLVQIFLSTTALASSAVRAQLGLWPFLREPYWCALLALTLNTAAYASEIIRGGAAIRAARPGRGGARLRHVAASCCSAASSCPWHCARRCRPTATRSS